MSLTSQFLHFPYSRQEQIKTNQGFYGTASFPHVLGAIDCMHVQLVPTPATAHIYCNHSDTYFINVQAIVDCKGQLTNVVAKYPGSAHDSYIFRHSTVNQLFQDGLYENSLLIGKNDVCNIKV